jgi:hypothetical protein
LISKKRNFNTTVKRNLLLYSINNYLNLKNKRLLPWPGCLYVT